MPEENVCNKREQLTNRKMNSVLLAQLDERGQTLLKGAVARPPFIAAPISRIGHLPSPCPAGQASHSSQLGCPVIFSMMMLIIWEAGAWLRSLSLSLISGLGFSPVIKSSSIELTIRCIGGVCGAAFSFSSN